MVYEKMLAHVVVVWMQKISDEGKSRKEGFVGKFTGGFGECGLLAIEEQA